MGDILEYHHLILYRRIFFILGKLTLLPYLKSTHKSYTTTFLKQNQAPTPNVYLLMTLWEIRHWMGNSKITIALANEFGTM